MVALILFRPSITDKNIQDKSYDIFSSEFDLFDNSIEGLHIAMSLDTSTSDTSLICFTTEPFLICTPIAKYMSKDIIYEKFHIEYLGRVPQNINTRNFIVKK